MKSLVKSNVALFSGRPIRDIFNKNLTGGISAFEYKDYIVHIAYSKNEYLRLSCLSKEKFDSQEMLENLILLGNETTDIDIVASYLMDRDDLNELMPTAEWNSNPEKRRRELKEGENLGFRCVNLRLYNECDNIKTDTSHVKKLKMGLF